VQTSHLFFFAPLCSTLTISSLRSGRTGRKTAGEPHRL